jgi:heme A synthase
MLAAPKSDVVNGDYNRARHIFAVFTTCAIFTLILAGALVTSNDAAPSVPDWPTSFGSIYKIPPMVGGPIRAWPSQELTSLPLLPVPKRATLRYVSRRMSL